MRTHVTVGFVPLLCCLACVRISQAADVGAGPASDSRVALPGFGIEFVAPKGWLRSPELHYAQLARFANVSNGKLVGTLEVDATPAKRRSAKDLAAKLARDRGGEVVESKPADRAGGDAVEMRLPPTKLFKANVAAVLPMHDQLVVFAVGVADADAGWAALRAVAASVVISEPKPAADDLALRKRPVSLFGSNVLVTLPEPFRPDKVDDPKAKAFFGARDWPSGRDEASVQIQAMPNPNGAELADVVATMADSLSAELKLPEPMRFEKVNDGPLTYLCSPFAGVADEDEAQRIMYTVLDDSRFALLIFRTTAPEARVRDQYMTMAEDVARGARVSEDYGRARGGRGE